ncbi:TonB family protein [Ideonella azotifigens]|uniref:energy transducer TonB family protein n=1 Tax=Ideonella azotifigens TaxID=513160 RepID=UPI0011441B86|nr:energy transducer TonB [Ideonella azotifigens]MCD2339566.1 TonB family protein [Ideonella azotifigens]
MSSPAAAAPPPRTSWRPSVLQTALLVSVAVHAVLLSLRFVDPERFNRIFEDTPLEVVLVNARSDERPEKAQAIAQASLAGGGEAETGRATSPLPPSPFSLPGEALDDAQRQIKQMQDVQQQLLADIRRELALLPPPDPSKPVMSREEAEREERRRQMLRTLAEIEKRINEENARPKKRYISPATREEVYAIYYDSLRRKIEERGTRDFPQYKGQKLYGELTMNLTIDAAGQVIDADVVRPSKSAELNRRAVAIVHAAGPFGKFTDAMRRQADQIVVTSRFRFTRTDGLEATAEATIRQ